MGKKRYIAVSVTTWEALKVCFAEQALLFCIENPLYSRLKGSIRGKKEAADYDIEAHAEKEIILMNKVRGAVRFDDERCVPFYLPLAWDGWRS